MAELKTDELNILSASDEAFDYKDFIEHYFDVMQISDKQKKQRIESAEELMDIILYFFTWCEEFPEEVNEEKIRQFENEYKEVIFEYAEPSDYLSSYVSTFMNNLIKVTLEHLKEKYFTSIERAANVAVNESNTIFNYMDLETAKSLGYTKKTWVAEVDDRTRQDHLDMNSWTVPIDDWFVFPDCMMQFAHDEVNGTANQCSNCRCTTVYS